jgi:hypothetical protein
MNRTPLRAMVLLAGILALAPAAHGQVACKDIDMLTGAAASSFAAILGPPIAGDSDLKLHAARFALPGASSCVIERPFEETYRCEWAYATEADLMRAYESQVAAIAPCLAGWKAEALLVDQVTDAGVRVLAGVGYLGNDDFATEVWSIVAGRTAGGGETGYLLMIEVSHY